MSDNTLYFDRNESQYGPAPACFEALRQAGTDWMSCYSRDFARGVKSRLSERLAADFGIDEKSILLGYGAEDLLKQTVHCFLGPGERILIPSHSWWYYKTIANEVEGLTVEYPIVEGDGEFAYDIPALLRIHDETRPALVLLSSPNNPTGNAMDPDDLQRVLRHMRETVVVLDEAYCPVGVRENGNLASLQAEFPKLLIVRTFSKYYALAGIRVGYAVLGAELGRLERFSARYLGYHRLSEAVAIAALDSPDYYRDIAAKMEEDREMFRLRLGALPGFTVYRSRANFVLVKLPAELMAPLKHSLLVQGMVVKFMDEEHLHSHMRITLGTQENNRRLVDAITAFMHGAAAA